MNRGFSAIVLGLLAWSIGSSKGSMKFFNTEPIIGTSKYRVSHIEMCDCKWF